MLIERSEHNKWAVGVRANPFVEADDYLMRNEQQIVIRFL
jgi:hypothetical protein